MSWQTELDRTLHAAILKASEDRGSDRGRTLANDLVAIAPARPESHFLVGVVEEIERRAAASAPPPAPASAGADGAEAPAAAPASAPAPLADSPGGDATLWRSIGRLDSAVRGGDADRVRALLEEPWVAVALGRAREGRATLRAAGRVLLAGGDEAKALDLYRRHLQATGDPGSRKDAETLLNEIVRRSDDMLSDGMVEDAARALQSLAQFAGDVELDARVRAKVDRKLGRAHQLAGRFSDAAGCFRDALGRLPADDRYRAVLNGDLALAALEVRGTLDLLPRPDRPGTQEAEALLAAGSSGEGESYNAIYTLGMLAYERGRFEEAAQRFGDADRLMREAHAKARIVHARARFFRGAALLRLEPTPERLAEARDLVLRDAGSAALDPALREEVFERLAAAMPDVRIPGRGRPPGARVEDGPPRGDRGDRGPRVARGPRSDRPERFDRPDRPDRPDRGDRRGVDRPPERSDRPDRFDRPARAAAPPAPAAPARSEAAAHADEARRLLDRDPRAALQAVDRVFKSRPSFDEWFLAYRMRLMALLAIRERDEALRTYERFRAKLHERGRQDRLEELLSEPGGPVPALLGEAALRQERVDLYEVMPDRSDRFVRECVDLAREHAASGEPRRLETAAALLREAVARGGDEDARLAWEQVCEQARAKGLNVDCPSAEHVRSKVAARPQGARVIVVGGDAARAPHRAALEDLGRRIGFQGAWIPSGARPLHQTLAEVEEDARRGASAILIHHTAGADLRASVRALATDLSIPVREIPYAGKAGVEAEVLTALGAAL